jgi:hypothetical protein
MDPDNSTETQMKMAGGVPPAIGFVIEITISAVGP